MEAGRLARSFGSAIALSLSICAIGTATASAQTLERIAIGWPANFSSNMGHLTFANDLGYYRDEGLDVTIISLPGASAVMQQILGGGIISGYAGVESAPMALQPGATAIPIRFVYNYMRQSIWEMAVPEASPIKTFADLKGKTIGTFNASSGNIIVTKAALGVSGIKLDDVKLLPVGFGAPALIAIKSNQVDALNLIDTSHASFEASGFALRRIAFPPQFEGNPSHGYPVTEDVLTTKRKTVIGLFRAISKGIIACDANIESCIRSFWKAHPALKPTDVSEDEAMKRDVLIGRARLKKLLHFRPGQVRLMGAYSDEDWKGVIDALAVGGAITKTDLPMDRLYTNELAKDFNDFDIAKVVEAARAAR
jgi:NitT/TauT family transport system substrate-binding protein